MADAKISALTNLTAADPTNDMIPIVDVSDTPPASGNTKRISINNILSSSPTASGALTVTGLVTAGSATVTGDLTVRTNKLVVTSTGVGANYATPTQALSVGGAVDFKTYVAHMDNFAVYAHSSDGTIVSSFTGYPICFRVANVEQYRIAASGVNTWSDGAGGTRMTLNSTGLGIGDSPSYKLHVAKTTDGTLGFFRRISGTINPALTVYCNETGNTVGFGTDYAGATSPSITFTTGGSERLRIDSDGNVIITSPATPATLATNGQLTVNATSNTNLRFSYRGSDGTTRVANITLA